MIFKVFFGKIEYIRSLVNYEGTTVENLRCAFEEAVDVFNSVYPKQSSSKIILTDVLLALKELKQTYRYELAGYLTNKNNLKSYGGKWAHSLSPYLEILKNATI